MSPLLKRRALVGYPTTEAPKKRRPVTHDAKFLQRRWCNFDTALMPKVLGRGCLVEKFRLVTSDRCCIAG